MFCLFSLSLFFYINYVISGLPPYFSWSFFCWLSSLMHVFFLFICRSFAAVMVTNPLKQRELFISSRASFQRYTLFYPFTPKSGQSQKIIQQNFQISLCEILKNKEYRVNVLLKRFHLNGNTIWFHPQTQKLELHTK